MRKAELRLPAKLALLVGISSIAAIAIAATGAMALHQCMFDARADKLQSEVNSALAIAGALNARVNSHEITQEQAFDLMHRDIRAIRFDNGVGYVSIIDGSTGVVLMHGANPSLEGKVNPNDAATGQPISRLILDAVRSSTEGTAHYMYQKPGQTVPLWKVVAAARFQPWNMVFYAGGYTDDLDASFNKALLGMGAVGGAILMIALLAAWLVSRDITGTLGSLRASMRRLAEGDLGITVSGTGRRDEVGEMAAAVLIFQQNMIQVRHLADQAAEARSRTEAEKRLALMGMAERIQAETSAAVAVVSERGNGMAERPLLFTVRHPDGGENAKSA
jgi:methyl-accepting chemotaxis protein